jgi:hypothetical protein
MTQHKIIGFVASLLCLAAAPALTACSTGGDRTGGSCPSGEQCSTLVDGLHFSGSAPRSHSLWAIAEGGTERVRVQTEPGLTGASYDGEFDARSSDESVLGIGTTTGSSVTLLGESSGTAFLRILEPGTNLLLDRVDVRVAPVESVRVSTLLASLTGGTANEITAVWSGASVQLEVALLDSDGGILWDDSLAVTDHPTTLVEIPAGLEFGAVAPASGTLELTLTRDAETHPISLPVVTDATGIALFPEGTSLEVEVGSTGSICALGRASGGLIAGAPVEATLPSQLAEDPTAAPTIDGEPLDGCIGYRGETLGSGTLTLSIGTQSVDVQVSVVAATTSPLSGPPLDVSQLHGEATPGERAGD